MERSGGERERSEGRGDKQSVIILEKIVQSIKNNSSKGLKSKIVLTWEAVRYPIRLKVNLLELMTSMMLKAAHEMS